MNKHEVVSAYADHHKITKKQANEEMTRFTDFVTYQLQCHGAVRVSGFGTFGTKIAKARTIISQMSPTPVNVPEKWIPYFKISPVLKAKVEE